MKILYVASEVTPFSKTGGLGDVAGALPAALASLGHDVKVVSPRYASVQDARLTPTGHSLELRFPFGTERGPILSLRAAPNLELLFLEHEGYYGRGGLYGDQAGEFGDNHRRYAYLSLGALQACQRLDFTPDILHVNDWQTGLLPVAHKRGFLGTALGRSKSVLTIHNLAYQGQFNKQIMPELGLPWDLFNAEQGLEFYDGVNFLKGGIQFCDALTTVSPTYAREIQAPEAGANLDGLLRRRQDVLSGILNGIDVEEWNPEADPHLPARYGPEDLTGKEACRRELLERFGLAPTDAPVFGIVSRLAWQKGVDLLLEVLPGVLEQGIRFVAVGSGEGRYVDGLQALQARFPGRVGTFIGFDAGLSHLVEAGADFFLMPSRYEPCGLNQMYSLRYGTVPVVRATGGLADTVREGPEGNGLVFHDFHPDALRAAIDRARALYADSQRLRAFQRRGMGQDFSWSGSARKYERLFASLLSE
ncbi:glycogen synthase GlgA [Melittangium boletus]|uniref:Glycogen synthase n=1 Tax=Melittangium boletus DSM 14713 TaxID=1294270 RepID=A0A250IJG5_9BACT|nr:glycogen synthase GlgA [Melittangium boletus]ATB31321.1 glycogen synthase [Melittangium boletus DSM 14713]